MTVYNGVQRGNLNVDVFGRPREYGNALVVRFLYIILI